MSNGLSIGFVGFGEAGFHIMAEAIVRRIDWSAELDLKQRFGGEAPQSYREVLDSIAKMSVAQVSDLR
jgi:hypothetical protein